MWRDSRLKRWAVGEPLLESCSSNPDRLSLPAGRPAWESGDHWKGWGEAGGQKALLGLLGLGEG